jgi:hypothetical protein
LNVFRNFCHVLQNSPKHFKISQYENCPNFRGTQLSCWMAFLILSGKKVKNLVNCQLLLFTKTEWHSKFGRNLSKICWEKHPRAFVRVVEGSEICNFPIHHFVHFYSNFWIFLHSNRGSVKQFRANCAPHTPQDASKSLPTRHAFAAQSHRLLL